MTKSVESIAHIATIASSFVAIGAFSFGCWQFSETQAMARENLELQKEALEQERENKAVELFIKFNEIQLEITSNRSNKKSDQVFWRRNVAMGITESIFNLTEGNDGWSNTIQWMLNGQQSFLSQEGLNCITYSPAFIELIKTSVPTAKCNQ